MAIISFWLASISWAFLKPLICATLFICSKYSTVPVTGPPILSAPWGGLVLGTGATYTFLRLLLRFR